MFFKEGKISNQVQKAKRARLKTSRKFLGNCATWHSRAMVKSNLIAMHGHSWTYESLCASCMSACALKNGRASFQYSHKIWGGVLFSFQESLLLDSFGGLNQGLCQPSQNPLRGRTDQVSICIICRRFWIFYSRLSFSSLFLFNFMLFSLLASSIVYCFACASMFNCELKL